MGPPLSLEDRWHGNDLFVYQKVAAAAPADDHISTCSRASEKFDVLSAVVFAVIVIASAAAAEAYPLYKIYRRCNKNKLQF